MFKVYHLELAAIAQIRQILIQRKPLMTALLTSAPLTSPEGAGMKGLHCLKTHCIIGDISNTFLRRETWHCCFYWNLLFILLLALDPTLWDTIQCCLYWVVAYKRDYTLLLCHFLLTEHCLVAITQW